MKIFLIAVLIVLNGLFALSEMAIAVSRRGRLLALDAKTHPGAAAALKLMEEPTTFLSTVQIGITSIGVLNGIVGEAAFSDMFSQQFMVWGLTAKTAGWLATALVVTLITFTTIVFGELVPKRIGQIYPETISRLVAPYMLRLAVFARPLVLLLSCSTHTVLRLIGFKAQTQSTMTHDEIVATLAEGVGAGAIEQEEQTLARNIFHLDERPLSSVMMPRSTIAWLRAEFTVEEALAWIQVEKAANHSRFPVCKESLDQVLGIITLASLLKAQSTQAHALLESLVETAVFVPETLNALEVLVQFKTSATHVVLVVDEYGVVQGLVTLRDIVEAITGELPSDVSPTPWAIERADKSWLLEGNIPVAELANRLHIKLPEEKNQNYSTLAGLLIAQSGNLPKTGEIIYCAGWRFEVVDLDGLRIDKVIAYPNESN